MNNYPRSIAWLGDAESGFLRLLDQTRLPVEVTYRDCHSAEDVWDAIKRLQVRGAPAIGVAAAYGVVLGGRGKGEPFMRDRLETITAYLASARPTAVNLFWALERMKRRASTLDDASAAWSHLLSEAQAIHEQDIATCKAIGEHGARLIPDGAGVLTHCNTGALATADYGTALAAMFIAHEQGKRFTVYVDETRPLLQGARLTAWELRQREMAAVLICDNMAGQVMKEGKVQVVLVGADRIAANGDTANKIGTYGVAVMARYHEIPFYVVAPKSTFDLALACGAAIPIEQRAAEEITETFGRRTAPAEIPVYNPAFDVTPASLITGIITEAGLIHPVNSATIQQCLAPNRNA